MGRRLFRLQVWPRVQERARFRDASDEERNQYAFGMKFHIGVDAGSGYAHSLETAVNVHDITVASRLIREDGEVI